MPDFFNLNPSSKGGLYGTPDTGKDLELAGDPNVDAEALAKAYGVSVDEAKRIKKSLEDSLKSGYVKYTGASANYMLDAQEKFIKENAGKAVLDPAGDGLYSARVVGEAGKYASIMGKTNDPAAKGTPFYDENATSRQTFYDAAGKRVSPADLARTQRGKALAAAGWDIGFGPGMIGPGIKAEPVERETTTETSASSSSTSARPVERSAPSPTPATPPPPPPPPPPVKTAPIDTILFDDTTVPIEIMTDLIFENIGGQEIISIVRNDTVNGQNIIYQPIKNLSLINQQYNPNNVLALQGTSDKYFENFIIKLSNKIPSEGNGPDGKNVYINNDTLDIVIDLINIEQDEQTEFQFRIDGTIYEAEL